MELKNRSFQYGKVALAVRTQKHQLQCVLKVAAVCKDTCALSNCSVSDVLVEATPLLHETLFQVVDIANPAMVDVLLEHAPHLSTGFRSGLLGGHVEGEMKSGVLRDKNSTVSPGR